MNPVNKQRIVGIIVLLAFAALLIPFLFTSGVRKKTSTSDEIPINDEKRQLITQQIQDIDKPVITQQPEQIPQPGQTISTAATIAPPQNQSEQQSVDTLLPPALPETLPEINSVTTEPAIAGPVVTEPAITESAAAESAALVKPVLENKNIKIVKAKSAKAKAKVGAKKFWSVQAGSFSDNGRAKKLAALLRSKGFGHVSTQSIATATGPLTRILVGHEVDKGKAKEIARRLEVTMKIKGSVVGSKK